MATVLTAVVVLVLAVVAVVAAAAEVLWAWVTDEAVLVWVAEFWVVLADTADVLLALGETVVVALLALIVIGAVLEVLVLALAVGAAVAADVAAWAV